MLHTRQGNAELGVLKTFGKMVVADSKESGTMNYEYLSSHGLILDFVPTSIQRAILEEYYSPINARTLFTVKERKNADVGDLLLKQVLHYAETYGGFGEGAFNLKFARDVVKTFHFVQGMTEDNLQDSVQKLLYANAPLKDANVLVNIIDHFKVKYDFDQIMNNEIRVVLFNPKNDAFSSGDDAVRWLCYNATGNPLLIKSKEVIAAVKYKSVPLIFFETHKTQLAKVFNRHKALILAAKNRNNRTVINEISRLSKKLHVPIQTPINKVFVSKALKGEIGKEALQHLSIRDKFKILNLLEWKRVGSENDFFAIRNGKIHHKTNRPVYDSAHVEDLIEVMLSSITEDLQSLNDKRILLDSIVDYGLPVSRKQSLGNLPYGTIINTNPSKNTSSGVYWRNEWGANDLDLSTIDLSGNRTGWGQLSGYTSTEVVYSGDLTSAYSGAMEFMTSKDKTYGVYVNIYSGMTGSKFELVVGSDGKNNWIEEPVVRERSTLDSRNSLIGFVHNNQFIVYQGRLNNSHVSGDRKSKLIVERGLAKFWTVKDILDRAGIKYDLAAEKDVDYDHNLTYSSFSYDKLESLLFG